MTRAKAKGWTEEIGESLFDMVDVDISIKEREFPSITKAKAWAVRNRALDLFNAPDINVYQWPNARRYSWERERVLHIKYIGGGDGWEEIV